MGYDYLIESMQQQNRSKDDVTKILRFAIPWPTWMARVWVRLVTATRAAVTRGGVIGDVPVVMKGETSASASPDVHTVASGAGSLTQASASVSSKKLKVPPCDGAGSGDGRDGEPSCGRRRRDRRHSLVRT